MMDMEKVRAEVRLVACISRTAESHGGENWQDKKAREF